MIFQIVKRRVFFRDEIVFMLTDENHNDINSLGIKYNINHQK